MGPATTGEVFGALQNAADGIEITCGWSSHAFEEVKRRVRERGVVTPADRVEGLAIRDADNAAGAERPPGPFATPGPWAPDPDPVPAAGTRVTVTTEQRDGWIVQPSAAGSPWIFLSSRETDRPERAWHVLLDTGEIRVYLESVLDLHDPDPEYGDEDEY